MSNSEHKAEGEKAEPTFEDLFKELPIPDKYKQALMNLITNMASSITQTNSRLKDIEAKAAEFESNPKKYEGMSADQVYQIEMAKAAAPAAAAQQEMISAILTGRGQSGGIDGLVHSAEALNTLRNFLMPAPTTIQSAMEKAQVSQIIAQTRLVNKLTGKTADKYLDGLEAELKEEGKE